ncbi:MAG: hypothetical protein QXL10_03860 [Candidatus Bathyarchaeia archaeon]
MNRFVVLLFITILAVESLFSVTAALASASIPKPTIPEFTVKFVDNSYDVPPTYGVDPYTGKKVMTQAGYHVQDKIVEVVIKNQPFIPYKDANGNSIRLYYSIRVKGHFGDAWAYPNFGYYYVEGDEEANYVEADVGSDYTVITYGLVGNNGTKDYFCLDVSAGGQVDFQVRAFIGYYTRTTTMTALGESHRDVFIGESSSWSNTQTITVNSNSSSVPSSASPNSQNPTAPSDQTGLNWTEIILFTVVGIMAALLALVVLLMSRRRRA